MTEAFIVDAVRTAVGRRGGGFSAEHPADMAAHVIGTVVGRQDVDPAAIDDVILGCLDNIGSQAGDIARSASSRLNAARVNGTMAKRYTKNMQNTSQNVIKPCQANGPWVMNEIIVVEMNVAHVKKPTQAIHDGNSGLSRLSVSMAKPMAPHWMAKIMNGGSNTTQPRSYNN